MAKGRKTPLANPGPPSWGLVVGLATPSHKIFRVTETEISTMINQPVRSDGCERQRMTPKPPMKLFSSKTCVKVGQWNIRTMHETGKCAQVISKLHRFNLDILGISKMRWNGCGKMTAATGETILYSGKSDEVDHHEQGVGLILSRRANNCLMEWKSISARIITTRFSLKWRNVIVVHCYAPTNSTKK